MEPSEREEGALLPPINGPTMAASAVINTPRWRPRSARMAPPAGSPCRWNIVKRSMLVFGEKNEILFLKCIECIIFGHDITLGMWGRRKIKWDPYESTMKHDFVFKPATEPNADCARAGKGQVIPFQVNEPTGRNTYKDEFCWKPYSKAEPIRSGSASGIRRNNPQPSDRFLVWKLPREEPLLPTDIFSPWTKPLTKQDIEETIKSQFKTVYSGDYLGLQPGVPRDLGPVAPDWKTLVPQPPDTEVRRHYQHQTLVPDLKDFTWKYGCNAKRHIPVKGAVPSVSGAQIWNHEHTKQLSTYQRDFGKDYLDILSVLNSLDPEEIKSYVERAPNPEKAVLQNFLNRVSGDKNCERPSSTRKPREDSPQCM